MTFGSVVIRTASELQTLTVTNSGGATLTGLVIATTGDFTLSGNQCPASLAAGLSCTTGVGFTPSTTGIRNGTLSVNTSSAGVPPAVAPLTGNGIPSGSLAVSPPVLNFGTVTVGQTSPSQTVTVSNSGATTLTGLTYQLTGDYSVAHNGCGTQLTSGAICTAMFTFSPSAPGTRIGALTIQSTTAGFTPVLIGLTGTGLPTVQLGVTPNQLAFGAVAIGSNSAAMQLTVSNSGRGILQGLSFATTAPFSVGSGSCGTSILPGGMCQAPVVFAPTAGGNQNGSVTVATTSLGVPPVQVPLSGSGLEPASLSVSPTTVTFPGAALGVSSAVQTVKITNSGSVALAGLSVAISGVASGDFTIGSSNCTGALGAGASCSAAVTFTPSVVGGRQGVLTASSSTQGVASAIAILNGTGLTPAALNIMPAQLNFAPTLVGQTSVTQIATVKNSGQAGITTLQLVATPGFGLDPTKTTCTAVLLGGATCQAGVLFAPAASGPVTGSITASSAQADGSGSIAATTPLTGTGALPPGIVALPAALVQFGTTGVGQTAQPVPVTLTNQGILSALTGFTLTLNATAMASGFGLSDNTCGTTLAAAASCTVNITFAPTGYGPLSGTLVASSTNGGNPVTLQLVGIGFDFRMAIAGSNSASVVQGQTADYTLALTTLGGSIVASGSKFSFQCDNLPANAVCIFNPTQLIVPASNVTGNVALGISTGAPSTTSRNTNRSWQNTTLMVCAVVVLPLSWCRRKFSRYRCWLFAVVLVALAGGLSSCAGSGGSTGSTGSGGSGGESGLGGGTPQGSYHVTITASVNNVVHSATVVLVVN
jgi:hypothetical protein